MPPRPRRLDPRGPLGGTLLLGAAVALHALSFIDPETPLYLCAFVSVVPAMAYARGRRPWRAALGGAAAGAASLGLSCSWLAAYHPLAIGVGMALGLFWYSMAFAALALVLKPGRDEGARGAPVLAPAAAAFVWSACEWGRSYVLVAFPYATLPYSQADRALAYAIASVGGVSLVGVAVALASASFYAAALRLASVAPGNGIDRKLLVGTLARSAYGIVAIALFVAGGPSVPSGEDARPIRVAAGAASPPRGAAREDGEAPERGYARVALIQPDVRSQKSLPEYRAAFSSLERLSQEALRYSPDLVAWHETAVVPPIEWHARYRPDGATYELIADVKRLMGDYPVPLLVGNAYASPDDSRRTVEHNAAILYRSGTPARIYSKVKLVPFSEYLPAALDVPFIAEPLVEAFGRFWTPGEGPVIFELGEARFAAPICFEDSFGRYLASFDGPDFFVVLTNDAWARSERMQRQHLAMSRFRAAETGTVVLRAASTGMTAAIDRRGAVAYELPPFTPGVLVVDVPLAPPLATAFERAGGIVEAALALIGATLSALSLVAAGPRGSLTTKRRAS